MLLEVLVVLTEVTQAIYFPASILSSQLDTTMFPLLHLHRAGPRGAAVAASAGGALEFLLVEELLWRNCQPCPWGSSSEQQRMQVLWCQVAPPAHLSLPGSLQAGAKPALPAAWGSVQCSGSPSMGTGHAGDLALFTLKVPAKTSFTCLFFLE